MNYILLVIGVLWSAPVVADTSEWFTMRDHFHLHLHDNTGDVVGACLVTLTGTGGMNISVSKIEPGGTLMRQTTTYQTNAGNVYQRSTGQTNIESMEQHCSGLRQYLTHQRLIISPY